MDFRRRMSWIRVALGIVLAIGVPLAAGAQNPNPNGGTLTEPYTPAPDAKDLKAVLFNWMWGMGMLKGHDERDMVAIARISGQGHDSGGRTAVHAHEISCEHQLPDLQSADSVHLHAGERTNRTRTSRWSAGCTPGTKTRRGAEIGPTKGKATPMPAAVQERLIRIWASPQGAPKAALAGTTETFWLGANPGTLFADGVAKVGQTSVSWESGQAGRDVPDSGRSGGDRDSHARCEVHDRARGGHPGIDDHRVHLRRLSGLEQPAEQDRGVLRRQDGRAPERRGRPRPDDGRDGDGQRVCGGAGAGKRAGGDQGHRADPARRVREERTSGRQVGAHAAAGRASRPDGQLDLHRLDWQLHDGRRAPMRSDAEARLQPADQSDGRFRALLALAVRQPESSDVQAGALGQGSGARHVDEQVRPGHDLPAAGRSAARARPGASIQTDKDVTFLYPGGDAGGGYGEYPRDPDRWPQARPEDADSRRRIWGIRWDAGKATRWCSTPSRSSIRRGWGAAASSTPIRCTSWRNSRVRAMCSCTTSRSKTLRCWWSRGCSRHEWCGATRIPTRDCCESAATARVYETEAAATQIRH